MRPAKVAALAEAAKRHGIYVFQPPDGTSIDFINETTGVVLGVWRSQPNPYFTLNGVSHRGSQWDALQALVLPYDLSETP